MHTEVVSDNMKRKDHLENLGIGKWMMVQSSGVDWMHLVHDGIEQLL